jgi:hypothetical protein
MAERAQVTSVEAIEAFRAALIIFLSKARPTLEEVSHDVSRTKIWVQVEQRNHWDKEKKIRLRALERAQAELFSARLSNLQEATGLQEMLFHRAQRAVREVEEKQAMIKKWDRELENRTEPMLKLVDQLHGYLTTDLTRAAAYLGEVVKALEAYADIPALPSSAPPSPANDIVDPEADEPTAKQ